MNTVLIIDDEDAVRYSLVDYFEDQEWNSIQAGSAEEALIVLRKEQPDAAVVDIRLPGMDGSDFIRETLKENTTTVFVISTGSPEYQVPDDLQASPQVYSELFKKPVSDMADLEKVLCELIETLGKNKK